jgi:hypothetical protein
MLGYSMETRVIVRMASTQTTPPLRNNQAISRRIAATRFSHALIMRQSRANHAPA